MPHEAPYENSERAIYQMRRVSVSEPNRASVSYRRYRQQIHKRGRGVLVVTPGLGHWTIIPFPITEIERRVPGSLSRRALYAFTDYGSFRHQESSTRLRHRISRYYSGHLEGGSPAQDSTSWPLPIEQNTPLSSCVIPRISYSQRSGATAQDSAWSATGDINVHRRDLEFCL